MMDPPDQQKVSFPYNADRVKTYKKPQKNDGNLNQTKNSKVINHKSTKNSHLFMSHLSHSIYRAKINGTPFEID